MFLFSLFLLCLFVETFGQNQSVDEKTSIVESMISLAVKRQQTGGGGLLPPGFDLDILEELGLTGLADCLFDRSCDSCRQNPKCGVWCENSDTGVGICSNTALVCPFLDGQEVKGQCTGPDCGSRNSDGCAACVSHDSRCGWCSVVGLIESCEVSAACKFVDGDFQQSQCPAGSTDHSGLVGEWVVPDSLFGRVTVQIHSFRQGWNGDVDGNGSGDGDPFELPPPPDAADGGHLVAVLASENMVVSRRWYSFQEPGATSGSLYIENVDCTDVLKFSDQIAQVNYTFLGSPNTQDEKLLLQVRLPDCRKPSLAQGSNSVVSFTLSRLTEDIGTGGPCATEHDCNYPQGKCGPESMCRCATGWFGAFCELADGDFIRPFFGVCRGCDALANDCMMRATSSTERCQCARDLVACAHVNRDQHGCNVDHATALCKEVGVQWGYGYADDDVAQPPPPPDHSDGGGGMLMPVLQPLPTCECAVPDDTHISCVTDQDCGWPNGHCRQLHLKPPPPIMMDSDTGNGGEAPNNGRSPPQDPSVPSDQDTSYPEMPVRKRQRDGPMPPPPLLDLSYCVCANDFTGPQCAFQERRSCHECTAAMLTCHAEAITADDECKCTLAAIDCYKTHPSVCQVNSAIQMCQATAKQTTCDCPPLVPDHLVDGPSSPPTLLSKAPDATLPVVIGVLVGLILGVLCLFALCCFVSRRNKRYAAQDADNDMAYENPLTATTTSATHAQQGSTRRRGTLDLAPGPANTAGGSALKMASSGARRQAGPSTSKPSSSSAAAGATRVRRPRDPMAHQRFTDEPGTDVVAGTSTVNTLDMFTNQDDVIDASILDDTDDKELRKKSTAGAAAKKKAKKSSTKSLATTMDLEQQHQQQEQPYGNIGTVANGGGGGGDDDDDVVYDQLPVDDGDGDHHDEDGFGYMDAHIDESESDMFDLVAQRQQKQSVPLEDE